MKNSRLYIGIEIKVREFDAKMLLACVAAEAGFEVILGQQRIFKRQLESMPPGIYLDKSVTANKTVSYTSLRKAGFHIVAYDAEGLAFFDAEEYQKRRLATETLKQIDYFFAWGEYQANVVREKMPDNENAIVAVGHPRIDMTRRELRGFYAKDVEALRRTYGQFILINTNFSLCNHIRGRDVAIEVLAKGGKIIDEQHRAYYLALREHKRKIFEAFVEMIQGVHQHFSDIPVVIRPHPIEDHGYYRQILPQNANLHIVHEGSVLPWLMAARTVIHNSCMTGIEAYLLERPVIAYQPIQDEAFDIYLPNALSDRAFSQASLIERLSSYLNPRQEGDEQRKACEEKRKIVENYLSGLSGQFACDRIVNTLKRIQPYRNVWPILLHRLYRKTRRTARNALKKIEQSTPTATNVARTKVQQQVFPGIDSDEIQEVLERFQTLTGRFSSVQVARIDKDVSCLYSKNKT